MNEIAKDKWDALQRKNLETLVSGDPVSTVGPSEGGGVALTDAAEEHARHVVYYSTRYDGKGGVKWQDDGGLHCTCDWSAPPAASGLRPWPEWHRHVVVACVEALTADLAAARAQADRWERLASKADRC